MFTKTVPKATVFPSEYRSRSRLKVKFWLQSAKLRKGRLRFRNTDEENKLALATSQNCV